MKTIKYSKIEEQKILKFIEKLSLQAGNLLERYQDKISRLKINYKLAQGVASNADLHSEKLIIAAIKKKFKAHAILAEESAYKKFKNIKEAHDSFKEAEYSWIVDPLDGTTNYLNRFDYYSVCICLAQYGVPYIGVVYRPSTGECFFSIKGKGSFVKNLKTKSKAVKIVHSKTTKDFKDTLLVTGFVSEKTYPHSWELKKFRQIMADCRGVRRMGSAALDLCYVATGLWDGYWEQDLAPWDMAAAGLICLEAKMSVSDFKGRAFCPFEKSIVAAPFKIHQKLTKILRD
jgi:myo-inositol-1(or 4)-monophosphatase